MVSARSNCKKVGAGRLEKRTLRERYDRLVLDFARKMAVWMYPWQDFSTHKG